MQVDNISIKQKPKKKQATQSIIGEAIEEVEIRNKFDTLNSEENLSDDTAQINTANNIDNTRKNKIDPFWLLKNQNKIGD
jgi:hypothetical protein